METAGMVHALEEIHRLLRPDGCLIDIHPYSDDAAIEVHQGKVVTFVAPVPAFSGDAIRDAENALTQVVVRRLFRRERAASFDFLTYASSVSELYAYYEEASAFDDSPGDEAFAAWAAQLAPAVEEILRAAGDGAAVAYRERAHMARLEPRR
jgi:hypothetical protein